MAFYITFLILEILSVVFGIYMGYHRGIIKATFRFCELAVAAVVSLILAKAASNALGLWAVDFVCALLDEPVTELIFSSENSGVLVSSLVGALLAPIFFALFFGIIKLASLIGFNTITNAIAKKAGESKPKTKASSWGGAGIGVLSSVLVCSILLSPFFCGLYMVGSVPEDDREDIVSYMGMDKNVAHEVCRVLPGSAPKHPVSLLFAKLATTTTVSGVRYCVIDEMPEMVCMFCDFLSSYESEQEEGKDDIIVLSNAISSTIPHMENSAFISKITSSVLNSVGETIKNGDNTLGTGFSEESGISGEMMNYVGDILSNITSDNITDNIEILVGDPEDDNDNGLLGIASELSSEENIKTFLEEGRAAELAEMLIEMEENPNLEATMSAVKNIGTTMFTESVFLDADEQARNEYIELIETSVNDILAQTEIKNSDFRESVEIAEGIITSAAEGSELSEGEIRLIAVFAVHHFCTEEYYDNLNSVSGKDIEAFLGIK